MNRDEIQTTVLHLVSEIAEKPDCTPDLDLMDDLGFSSIAVMELISALEEQYSIKIPPRQLRFVATVADLVDLIAEKTAD